MGLLVFHGTRGVVCSRLATLMLLNSLFSTWPRDARGLDIVLANVAQSVPQPFQLLRDNSRAGRWGFAVAHAQYPLEARFALLAPLLLLPLLSAPCVLPPCALAPCVLAPRV